MKIRRHKKINGKFIFTKNPITDIFTIVACKRGHRHDPHSQIAIKCDNCINKIQY